MTDDQLTKVGQMFRGEYAAGDSWPVSWQVVAWAGFFVGVMLSGFYIRAEGTRDWRSVRTLWYIAFAVWLVLTTVMLAFGSPVGVAFLGGSGCVGALFGTALWFWLNSSNR